MAVEGAAVPFEDSGAGTGEINVAGVECLYPPEVVALSAVQPLPGGAVEASDEAAGTRICADDPEVVGGCTAGGENGALEACGGAAPNLRCRRGRLVVVAAGEGEEGEQEGGGEADGGAHGSPRVALVCEAQRRPGWHWPQRCRSARRVAPRWRRGHLRKRTLLVRPRAPSPPAPVAVLMELPPSPPEPAVTVVSLSRKVFTSA